MAAGIGFSRRVFLSLIGFASVLAVRMRSGEALPAAVPGKRDELVVVGGWILRRADLEHLGPQ